MTLTLITVPSVDPVTLAEVKEHLRVDFSDDDALIGIYVQAAINEVDGRAWLGRALITQTWELTLDEFPDVIRIPLPPLQSVTSVKYTDTAGAEQTLVVDTDYKVDAASEPGRITPAFGKSWPATRDEVNAVRVRFVAGYGDASTDIPDAIRSAIFMGVADLYANREGQGRAVVKNAAVQRLLTPYRIFGLC